MKKYLIAIVISILLASSLVYAKTPMYSTEVDQGLAKMFSHSGLVDAIYWSTGQKTTYATLGSGSGNASYPINLAGGTETAGILPLTQGGWGTDTTGTIGVVAGKIGIGTTTPATTLHVIGTITASTGFSGNGSALTGIVSTPALDSVDATHLKSTINATDTNFLVGSLTVSSGSFRLDSTGSATTVTLTVTGTTTSTNLTVTNLTVTQTATLPAQESTTGSASVTVGAGQSYTINAVGSSTNTIVLNCSGVISATNTGSIDLSGSRGGVTLGTTTYSNRYSKPKHFAVSTAVATATASLTGTTTETAMATIPVPAGFMAPTGSFLLFTNWSAPSGEGAAKTINLRFGTGTGITGSLLMGHALLGSTIMSVPSFVSFGNFGSTTKQIGQRRFDTISATAAGYQTSINTALDTYIVVTATLGTVTDTVYLENYWIDYSE